MKKHYMIYKRFIAATGILISNFIYCQITNVAPTQTTYCSGDNINIDITVSTPFNTGNIFTIELSDVNGGFLSPTSIGSIASDNSIQFSGNLPLQILSSNNYRVRVLSTNPSGVSSESNPFTINSTASLTVSANNVCSNSSAVELNAFPPGGTYTPISGLIGNFLFPQLTGTGTFNVTYSIPANGCTNTAIQQIEVNPLPVFSVSPSGNVQLCQGGNLNLIVSSAEQNLTYNWNPGNLNNDTLSINQPGIYEVTVTGTNGCSSTSSSINVTLSQPSPSQELFIPTEVCLNSNPILLSANPSGGSFSGINVSGGFFFPNQSGNFTINYSYVNSAGCSFSFNGSITVNELPQINFNPLPIICLNSDPINLTPFVNQTGGVFSGLGVSNNTFNPQQSGFGIIPITYTLTDQNNCSNSAQQTINVLQSPNAIFNFEISSLCSSADSILLQGGIPPGGEYSGTGVLNGYFYPTLANLGQNFITYTVSNAGNCLSSVTDSISVYNFSVNAGQDVTIPCGQPVQLNAISSGGQNISYSWTPSNGLNNPFTANPLASPSVTTSYVISASDGSCSSSDTVIVNSLPADFNLDFSSINVINNPPFNVTFTNNTPNFSNYNFIWIFGDGTTANSNQVSVVHQYLTNGIFSVTLIATNIQSGCSDTLIKPDWITTNNACIHSAEILQTGPLFACVGDSVLLSAVTNATITPILYQWNRNGTPISGTPNSVYYPTISGLYSVTIFSAGCPTTSQSIELTFNNLPTPPVITPIGNTRFCLGQDSVVLEANGGFQNYIWRRNNESFSTGQSITAYITGFYTVTGVGANGCASTSQPYGLNTSYLDPPEMCVVTVDTTQQYWNKNIISWKKPITNAIDGYIIYRESIIQNVFDSIAFVPYSQLSEYVDTDPSVNPQVRSYRYRMAVRDTCMSWSLPGSIHRTIHLKVLLGTDNSVVLNWNNYEGVQINTYEIRRGSSPLNDEIIETIPAGIASFTDNPPSNNLDTFIYRVNMVFPQGYTCFATNLAVVSNEFSIMAERRKTASNVGSNYLFVGGQIPFDVGLRELKNVEIAAFEIYPNPTYNHAVISFDASEYAYGNIKIYDILGNLVSRTDYNFGNGNNIKLINIDNLPQGIYMVQLNMGNKTLTKKLIKQ